MARLQCNRAPYDQSSLPIFSCSPTHLSACLVLSRSTCRLEFESRTCYCSIITNKQCEQATRHLMPAQSCSPLTACLLSVALNCQFIFHHILYDRSQHFRVLPPIYIKLHAKSIFRLIEDYCFIHEECKLHNVFLSLPAHQA